MKTDELNLNIDELDKLCCLYMDCQLSVLEEKELEYILSLSSLTSPSIEEVRSLMMIPVPDTHHSTRSKANFRIWKYITGIAASLMLFFSVGYYFFSSRSSGLQDSDSTVYIAAYSQGERLNDKEAVSSTTTAMAKADSLIKLASLTEHEFMLKANEIINKTLIN